MRIGRRGAFSRPAPCCPPGRANWRTHQLTRQLNRREPATPASARELGPARAASHTVGMRWFRPFRTHLAQSAHGGWGVPDRLRPSTGAPAIGALAASGLVLLVATGLAPRPARAAGEGDQVTIYRCTDAGGHVTLRDTPCAAGQKQDARTMLRPRDSTAPPVAPSPPPPPGAAPAPAERIVVLRAPQPMYVCTTPDGEQYTSDTPEGNPRWVPLWTLDYPVLAERSVVRPGGGHVRVDRGGHVSGELHTGSVERRLVPTLAAYGAGTWVRDRCHALPQAEVCDRLRDRRDAIGTRFFNAMPSERERLRVEERGIDARLDADCGGRR